MNTSIPAVTIIKFSRWKIIWFIAMVLVAVAGFASCIQGGGILKYIMAIVCMVLGAGLAFLACRDLRYINQPQLTISSTGMQVYDREFYKWENINNEKIIRQGSFKPTYFLAFETPDGNRRLHLDGLDKSPDQITALIKQYRATDNSSKRKDTDGY